MPVLTQVKIVPQNIVIQNLYLYKVCLVNFHLNETDCNPQNSASVLDVDSVDKIQRHVSDINTYADLIENIPNVVFVLFLGPWSDKNGRKVPMMAPLVGHLLSVGLYMANFYFKSWPAEYILLASIPLGLCGGTATLFMALNRSEIVLARQDIAILKLIIFFCCSYIADITSTESRTWRFSLLYGSILISHPAAHFSSIYIYTSGGYFAIFGTSFGLGLLTLLYIIFCITDSRSQMDTFHRNKEASSLSANCNSVLSNLWECFSVTFQRRKGYTRACIIILLISMCLNVFSRKFYPSKLLSKSFKFIEVLSLQFLVP